MRSRRLRMFVALIVSSAVLSGACGSDNEPSGVNEVAASGETEPVLHHADAADDPAIWVHPSRPGRSLVIGTDKVGALETYALSGRRLQRFGEINPNNVDVRGNFGQRDGDTPPTG